MHILLTGPEAERVAKSHNVREALGRWGVTFAACSVPCTSASAADSGSEHAPYVQVPVDAVPEVVADKVCLFLSTPRTREIQMLLGSFLQAKSYAI